MPITPRLKQLYLSENTARHMIWHKEGKRENPDPDIMAHPADGEAWAALDRFDPDFASDPRSVRIGLATDGFTPFSTSATPTPVGNLPPALCMKDGYMFLALVVP